MFWNVVFLNIHHDEKAFLIGSQRFTLNKPATVEYYIIKALCKLEDTLALPTMLKALKNRDPYVRELAASALSKIGDTVALQKLKHLIKREVNQDVKDAMQSTIEILEAFL